MAQTLRMTLMQGEQSVVGNYTKVTAKVICDWSGGNWSAYKTAGTVTIGDTEYDFFVDKFNYPGKKSSGSQTVCTKTVNVYHNSDGTKTVSASATYERTTSGTMSVSKSLTLTTIPRASSLTLSDTDVTI